MKKGCEKPVNKLGQVCSQAVDKLLQRCSSKTNTVIIYSSQASSKLSGTCFNLKYIVVETPRKFIIAKLSIRKPRSSSVLIIIRIESFAMVNFRGVSTKLFFDRQSPCKHTKILF